MGEGEVVGFGELVGSDGIVGTSVGHSVSGAETYLCLKRNK